MEIDGTGPWVGWKCGIRRLDAPLQVGANVGGSRLWAEWDPQGWSKGCLETLRLKELIQKTPDIREEKIIEVQGDLEGGTYSVMAERIAEKIIGDNLLGALL